MKVPSSPLTVALLATFFMGIAAACKTSAPLPPRYYLESEQELQSLRLEQTVAIAGTGSMKPYIPDSENPRDIVAIASVETPPYEELTEGDLVVYRGKQNLLVIHQIVARLGASWIASGLNNPRSDGPAVNRDTFRSRVKSVYILPETSRRRMRTIDAVLASQRADMKIAFAKPKVPLKTRRASRPS